VSGCEEHLRWQAEGGGIYESSPQARDTFVAELESRGFQVTLDNGASRVKGATLAYRDEVDAAFVVANIVGYAAENNYRIWWKTPMSTDCPWYVHEVPAVMVSLNYTTHLHDATMVKAYINAYHDNAQADREVAGEALTDRGLASLDVTPRSRRHTGYKRCDVEYAV
jgi:beta-N-acetylhexosaminidase